MVVLEVVTPKQTSDSVNKKDGISNIAQNTIFCINKNKKNEERRTNKCLN